ncbi:MAG: rod shape-determining protein MreD [Candidatus Margulisiibacteriota bacterium]
MQNFKLFLWLLFFFLLQSVILPRWAVLGVKPDLFFVILVMVAFTQGILPGIIFGMFAGLLQDFLSSGLFVHTIGLVVWACVASTTHQSLAGEGVFGLLKLVALLTPLYNIFGFLLLILIYHYSFTAGSMFFIVVLSTIFNVLAAGLIFPILSPYLLPDGFRVAKKDVITYF